MCHAVIGACGVVHTVGRHTLDTFVDSGLHSLQIRAVIQGKLTMLWAAVVNSGRKLKPFSVHLIILSYRPDSSELSLLSLQPVDLMFPTSTSD